ncbi:MAG TPA: hemolysin family protein [Actinomycetota bacterium]|nr:hemolysin family protein [Actinomycetota bacterium]
MTALIGVVAVLLVLGAVLAMAEASMSRMSRVRAMALEEEGRRNAALLERIQSDPARYLNSIYLAVMFVQNGSAILVAIIAEHYVGSLGITLISLGFTALYFLLVEAMAKTFGILHHDRVALTLAPLVSALSRVLSYPVRALITIANILLPGRGLKQGPFVSEEEIRSMAEVAAGEAAIEQEEKEMIHSIFEFGDTVVREVMVPRPDMVAVHAGMTLDEVLTEMLEHGFSRMPVWESEERRNISGLVYAKDVMRRLHSKKRANGARAKPKVRDLVRKAMFVPESKKVAELLREMQAKKTHMAIVVDEYGDINGLVTLEDLLEEIVGEIADEYDREEPQVQPIDDNTLRVSGRLSIDELSELLDLELPDTEWDTVGGLMAGLLGKVPATGDEVRFQGIRFRAERVRARRIDKILIERGSNGAE